MTMVVQLVLMMVVVVVVVVVVKMMSMVTMVVMMRRDIPFRQFRSLLIISGICIILYLHELHSSFLTV